MRSRVPHTRSSRIVNKLALILIAIFLPPVAVVLKRGFGKDLLINILLSLLVFFQGMVHAQRHGEELVITDHPGPSSIGRLRSMPSSSATSSGHTAPQWGGNPAEGQAHLGPHPIVGLEGLGCPSREDQTAEPRLLPKTSESTNMTTKHVARRSRKRRRKAGTRRDRLTCASAGARWSCAYGPARCDGVQPQRVSWLGRARPYRGGGPPPGGDERRPHGGPRPGDGARMPGAWWSLPSLSSAARPSS